MRNAVIGRILRICRAGIPVQRGKTILIPPAESGSLGDQAMMEGAADWLSWQGKVAIVGEPGPNMTVRAGNVSYLSLGGGKLRKLRTFFEILRAERVVFLGADVIDGVYSGDCRRLGLLDLAVRAGLQGACLGFSISPTPADAAAKRLRNLPDMRMNTRDPVSRERFRGLTGRSSTLVADLAFLVTPEARAPGARLAVSWIRGQKARGRSVLAVNAGGTTLSKMPGDGLAALEECLGGWLETNPDHAVLLMPHDFRHDPIGDSGPLEQLYAQLSARYPERLHFVPPPFDTWDAKAIAGEVDFAMTGRMHFAIACLGMGTPPLGIAYQGKFEGLMQHFDLTEMLLPVEQASCARSLRENLERIEAHLPLLRQQIRTRLPAVKALAQENFAWITPASGAVVTPVPLNEPGHALLDARPRNIAGQPL